MALDGEAKTLCEGLLQIGERKRALRKKPRSFRFNEEPPPPLAVPDQQMYLFPQLQLSPDLQAQETPERQLCLFPDILKAQAAYEVRALCALLSAQPSVGNGRTRHEH